MPRCLAESKFSYTVVRNALYADPLNAYVGSDLIRYQYGQFLRKDHINKRGNPKARAILFLAVRNMIRQQSATLNHIVDYYYK